GSGNIYVTGGFVGSVDFDPGPGIEKHISNGMVDIFFSKFDTNGAFIWAQTWGGIHDDCGVAIDADNSGNIYVMGDFIYSVDFDPGPGEDWHISGGSRDIFLSKFDSNGNFIWARTWEGDCLGSDSQITTDNTGNIFVPGYYRYTVDFDPGPEEDLHTANGANDAIDSFLIKFLPNGYWE
ncbi:hypothetical protein KKB99_01035, partial [bacterium]|nr:hypothetical protein [bacterium]MBU1024570.1 hypothetical protein [bacterium]